MFCKVLVLRWLCFALYFGSVEDDLFDDRGLVAVWDEC